jgi:hypothetical protein
MGGDRADRRRVWADCGSCLIVLVLLVWQLFIPPALSIADNNDFAKLAGRVCLGPPPQAGPPLFDYTILHWRFSPESCYFWQFRTTAEAPVRAAVFLNRLFHSSSDFDLRFLGAVYVPIFMLGFVTLQRALRSVPLPVSALAQCLWILVTCNAVYVPYFNTFYFDALTLATLTGALASVGMVVLRARVTTAALLMASFWLMALAGSKSTHSLIALSCVAGLWVTGSRVRFPSIPWRVACTAMVLGGAAWSIASVPRMYSGDNSFCALFLRILPAARDPMAYLRETRIPPSWIRYSGLHVWSPGSPIGPVVSEEQFTDWFGTSDLIGLYARHPSAAWVIAETNLEEASLDRVTMKIGATEYRLGNYERSTVRTPQTLSQFFTWWPFVRRQLFAYRPIFYLVWICAVISLLWTLAPPVERIRVFIAIVTVSLAVEFAVAMLSGADGGRHLTIFNYLLDLALCCDISFATWRFPRQEDDSVRRHSSNSAEVVA